MMGRVLGVALAWFLASGVAWAGPEVPFESFIGNGGPEIAGTYRAVTNEEWAEMWRRMGQIPPKPLDEGKETGVGVFMGKRPTGGYHYTVRTVERATGHLRVSLNAIEPTAFATQGESSPYIVLLVKTTAPKVLVDVRTDDLRGARDMPKPAEARSKSE